MDKVTRQKNHLIAYSCFLICGIFVLLSAIISLIPMGSGIAGSIGFLILIPLSVASIFILLLGVWKSIQLRNNFSLTILSILSILFVAEILGEFGAPIFYQAVILIYGLLSTIIPLYWFITGRKGHKA